jgi:AraC-like DNA-binding protein
MLLARGQRRIGGATLYWAHVFTGAGWLQIIESDEIVVDTRIIPPSSAPPKKIVCLLLFARGRIDTFGALEGRFSDRTALALRHRDYEGADAQRTMAFRIDRAPCSLVELHFAADAFAALPALPATLALDEAAWDAATRAARLSASNDATLEQDVRDLFERLAALGAFTTAGADKALRATPAPIARLWGALKPTIEHLALAVTAGDLGAGASISASQAERAFRRWAAAFALAGPGIRNVTHNLRLKTAVLFLSAPEATVAGVAEATGYGSADAMARAFRDAGVAPPSVVQQQLRAETK